MKHQLLTVSIAVLLATVGCEKKSPEDAAAATTTQPNTTTAAVAKEATEGTAGADAADACKNAYADTVKLVQAMQETMKRTQGEDSAADEYSVPTEADYLALCAKLPAEMQQCLVLEYAMQNKDACQSAQDALTGEAKAAYAELMGK